MDRRPPTLDMLPDGTFRTAPPPLRVPFSMKVAAGGVLVAALAVSLTVAAAAIWVVSMLLPVIVIGGGVAWGALKWREWQASLRGQRNIRPGQPGGFGQ